MFNSFIRNAWALFNKLDWISTQLIPNHINVDPNATVNKIVEVIRKTSDTDKNEKKEFERWKASGVDGILQEFPDNKEYRLYSE